MCSHLKTSLATSRIANKISSWASKLRLSESDIFYNFYSVHLQLTRCLSIWLLLINLTLQSTFSQRNKCWIELAPLKCKKGFRGLKCAPAKPWNKFSLFCLIDQEKIFRICKTILNPEPSYALIFQQVLTNNHLASFIWIAWRYFLTPFNLINIWSKQNVFSPPTNFHFKFWTFQIYESCEPDA